MPGALLVDAGATPVPDGDGPPRAGVGRHPQRRRTGTGRRRSRAGAPACATRPARPGRPPSARGSRGRAPRARWPSGGSAARAAVGARRGPPGAGGSRSRRAVSRAPSRSGVSASARSAPGPQVVTWTPSARWRRCRVAGPSGRAGGLPDAAVGRERPGRVAAAAAQAAQGEPQVEGRGRPVDAGERRVAVRAGRARLRRIDDGGGRGHAAPLCAPSGDAARWHASVGNPARAVLARQDARMTIRTGISGWRYAPWRGAFYPTTLPQRSELEYASSRLTSIEINGSFYALQKPENFQTWSAQTPDDFVFSIKAPRFITHMKKLADVRTPGRQLPGQRRARARPEARPGALAAAAEPRVRPRPADRVLRPPAADHGGRRGPGRASTTSASTAARGRRPTPTGRCGTCSRCGTRRSRPRRSSTCCARTASGSVVADADGRWPVIEDVTSDLVYLRLHGDKELYASGYDDESLDRWAARVQVWADGRRTGRRRSGSGRTGRAGRPVATCSSTSTTTSRSARRTTRWRSRPGWASARPWATRRAPSGALSRAQWPRRRSIRRRSRLVGRPAPRSRVPASMCSLGGGAGERSR